jgi:hypothetical protein
MSILWSDVAGDGLANNREIYSHPAGRVENAPRNQFRNVFTPVTATTYFTLCFFEKGQPITNIGCYIGSTAAATPTSSWFGIWTHNNYPPIRSTVAGGTPGSETVYSSTRTAGSATVTIASGTYPMKMSGRAITSTGIPAGRWVRSQTTTTLTLNDGTSVTAGTSNATIGQFMGAKYNLGFTTNGATGAIAANAAYSRPLSPGPYVIPAAGLYFLSFTFAATTMPSVVCYTADAGVPVTFYNDAPAWAQTHVNGTTNNTAPGTNPVSGGTSADQRTIPYMFTT